MKGTLTEKQQCQRLEKTDLYSSGTECIKNTTIEENKKNTDIIDFIAKTELLIIDAL